MSLTVWDLGCHAECAAVDWVLGVFAGRAHAVINTAGVAFIRRTAITRGTIESKPSSALNTRVGC